MGGKGISWLAVPVRRESGETLPTRTAYLEAVVKKVDFSNTTTVSLL